MDHDSKGPDRVCLGIMVGAHGVRGLVKVKSFTEVPEDVAAYGPLSDEAGKRQWTLESVGRAKGVVLARVAGVADRDQAQALHGTRLYVERNALPALEEEETFYHADLIGLRAEDAGGRPLGRVQAVENFGAGDLLEIVDAEGKSVMLPFTKAAVPTVNLAAGHLVVVLPEEVVVPPREEGPEDGREDGPEAASGGGSEPETG